MSYDLSDVQKPATANPGAGGGIKSIIYAVLEEDVVTLPARGADLVTIAGDIVLKADKYIHQIYATEKTIEPVEKKLKGSNRDSGGFEISLKFFHPGVEAAIQEFKAKHSNSSFYVIIKNCAASKKYLIGDVCNTVWVDDFETKFGKDLTEDKGTNFTFLCQQPLPMAIYAGKLDELLAPSDSGDGL